jgi:serine/threonine protein kinase
LQDLQERDPQWIGPYRLLRRLGAGGMGRVYLGRSPAGRPVAVKVIREELATDPEFLARFTREVAAAKSVSGIFTASVVDADTEGPEPWLATAYVAGPSLAQAVRDYGPLPVVSARALAAGLAEGLAAIHAAGLVHRDLKPSNVLLAEDGPRVIDFGISQAAQGTALTHTGLVIGSPGFMSPEQAVGGVVGPPSDVFSLGAVIAFAATGRAPFGDGNTAALVYRVVHAPPAIEDVPDELRPLVERCLAKDPDQRPTTAELLADLDGTALAGRWLPESVTAGLPRHVPPVPQPDSSEADQAASGVPGAGQGGPPTITVRKPSAPTPPAVPGYVPATPARTPATPPERRTGRRLAVLGVCAALLLAAGAAGALAVSGADHRQAPATGAAAAETSPTGPVLRGTTGQPSSRPQTPGSGRPSPSGTGSPVIEPGAPSVSAPGHPSASPHPSATPGNPGGGSVSSGAITTVDNEHLSGYSVYPESGTLTSVQASWHIPAVTCPATGTPRVVVWTGMWGTPASQQAGTAWLPRIGTESLCDNGQVSYLAVWELGTTILGTDEEAESFQALPVTVSPGDAVTASVAYLGSNSTGEREFSLTIGDGSNGGSTVKDLWTNVPVPLADIAYQGGVIVEDHNQYGGLANFSQSPVAVTNFTEAGGTGGFSVFDYEMIVNNQLLTQNSVPAGTLGPPPNGEDLGVTFRCNGCLAGFPCPPPTCLQEPA